MLLRKRTQADLDRQVKSRQVTLPLGNSVRSHAMCLKRIIPLRQSMRLA